LPGAFLQTKLWRPQASTTEPRQREQPITAMLSTIS